MDAQEKCDEYNRAHGFEITPAAFWPAPGKYQGFNRRQRRDGTAKRWLEAQLAKAEAKAKLVADHKEAQTQAKE